MCGGPVAGAAPGVEHEGSGVAGLEKGLAIPAVHELVAVGVVGKLTATPETMLT